MKNIILNFFIICLIVVLAVVCYSMFTANFEAFVFSTLLAIAIILTIIILPTKYTGLVK